jgi:hypothetical protein
MSDSTVLPVSTDEERVLACILLDGVIGGPGSAELQEIEKAVALAVAGNRVRIETFGTMLGGLLAVARGPFGAASQSAILTLRKVRWEVER